MSLVMLALRQTLVAQREFQRFAGGLETRLLQRAFERGLVATQEVVGVRALDHEARGHIAVAVHVQPHVDAPEFGRVEPDFEASVAGLRLRRNLDGDGLDGDRLHGADGSGVRGGGGRACGMSRRDDDVLGSGSAMDRLRAAVGEAVLPAAARART